MGQDIYYKSVTADIIKQFSDTSKKTVIKQDLLLSYKKEFEYVLKFFPKMEFEQIEISATRGNKISKTIPSFSSMFQSPEKRKYTIALSSGTTKGLDSLIFLNLNINSRIGLISRQVAIIENLSTSGFFDMIFWHFKNLSKKGRTKLEHEAELKVLETGLGYQLLALSRSNDEKMKHEEELNTKSYKYYYKNYKNRFMDPESISNFIMDMPVYAVNNYK